MKKLVVILGCFLIYNTFSVAADEESLAATRLSSAETLEKSGHYKQAYLAYYTVDFSHPFSPEAKKARSRMKALQATYKKKLPAIKLTSKALYDKALLCWEKEDEESAILYFSKLAKEYPADKLTAKALLMLGRVELESAQFDEEIAAMEKTASLQRDVGVASYYVALTKGRKGNYADAIAILQGVLQKYPASEIRDRAYYYLGYYQELNDQPAEALQSYWNLLEKHPHSDWTADAVWRIGRIYYWSGNYAEAYKYLSLVNQYPRSDATIRALYFQAKAAEKIKKPEEALAIYQYIIASFDSSYYSFRAQEQISDYQIPTAIISPETAASFEAATSYSETEYNLSQLFQQIKDYRAGIRLVEKEVKTAVIAGQSDAVPENIWYMAYPRGYFETVTKKAAANNLDPYLVLAVIREESRFNAAARSRSSARGLMQIMPSTGRLIAKDLNLKKYRTSKLNNPAVNIDMGTYYLSNLINRFDGNVYLAVAGYNGGPNRIKRYVNNWYNGDMNQIDIDEFIESIPVRETRLYVQKVMESYFMYKRIYGT